MLKGTSEIPSHFPGGVLRPGLGMAFAEGHAFSGRESLPMGQVSSFQLPVSSWGAEERMSLFMFIKCNGLLTQSLTVLEREKPWQRWKAAAGDYTHGLTKQYFVLLFLNLEG